MANEGYAKVATLMSHHGELAIFRRFTKLNYQNMLYLQAELTHLEVDINTLAIRDAASPGRGAYSSHWWHLAQSEESHDDDEQWDKALQIREKLNEYSMNHVFMHKSWGRPHFVESTDFDMLKNNSTYNEG